MRKFLGMLLLMSCFAGSRAAEGESHPETNRFARMEGVEGAEGNHPKTNRFAGDERGGKVERGDEFREATRAELAVRRGTSFAVWSTYVKTAKRHPEVEILQPVVPKGVRERRGVAYTVIDTELGPRPLRCDVYRPDDGRKLPAVLMIHGGGWNSGSRELQVPMAQRLAAAGFVAIPIE